MRRLPAILAIIVAIFVAYWFAVARGVEGSLRTWVAARAAEGWVAEYGALKTEGFPREFRTVVTDLTLADPDTGVAWTAPRFAFEAAAFRPNRITVVWPDTQTVASPWERIAVTSDRFRATVEFAPGTRLELRAMEADLAAVALDSTLGWSTRVETARLSVASVADAANSYRIDIDAAGLTLPRDLRRRLDPARLLPERVDGMVVTADVGFDAPWDRLAIEVARPQVTAIDLGDLRAQWGGIEVRAAGELTVDADGIPDGRVTVKITNWRDLLRVAGNAGLLPEPLMPTIERAFEILAGLSGPPETLDAPLTFSRGIVSFGPVPLGPAPRLVIR